MYQFYVPIHYKVHAVPRVSHHVDVETLIDHAEVDLGPESAADKVRESREQVDYCGRCPSAGGSDRGLGNSSEMRRETEGGREREP